MSSSAGQCSSRRLGLSSFAWHWAVVSLPALEAARFLIGRAADLELGVVQLADDVDLAPCSVRDLEGLRQRAADSGVSLELGVRGLDAEPLQRHVETAAILGGGLLRLVPGLAGPGHELVSPHQLTAALTPVLESLEACGVVLAVENHSTVRDGDLVECLHLLDSPWVGVCLDTANSVGLLEKPADTVALLAPHARSVHLKDFAIVGPDMGYRIVGAALGEGDLPLEAVAPLLAGAPHRPNILIELWVGDGRKGPEALACEEQWVRRSVTRARRLFAADGPAPLA